MSVVFYAPGMRTFGKASELERRRRLAVARHADGYTVEEIADFLGVTERSVWRWVAASRLTGEDGLAARPAPGRPAKLTRTQEKVVGRWLAEPPTAFGFATELWTAGRLAAVMADQFGVTYHPNYLCHWLRLRGDTPQKPERVPRERDPAAIAGWRAGAWQRIKKASAAGRPSCS
jgi:transposase